MLIFLKIEWADKRQVDHKLDAQQILPKTNPASHVLAATLAPTFSYSSVVGKFDVQYYSILCAARASLKSYKE